MKVPISPNERALHWYELDNIRAAVIAISAAGLSIVGPEVTEEAFKDSPDSFLNQDAIKEMLAAGDLARKPE